MNSTIHQTVINIIAQMANGGDMVSEDNLEEFLCVVSGESEAHLYDALTHIKMTHPALHVPALKAFGSIAYFFEDSKIEGLKKYAKRAIINNKQSCLVEDLLSVNGGELEGVELSNDRGDLFCIFTKEAYGNGNGNGGFRFTTFDVYGFSGHFTRKDYDTCLLDAVDDGFRNIVVGIIDKLAVQPAFKTNI